MIGKELSIAINYNYFTIKFDKSNVPLEINLAWEYENNKKLVE
jgi:hypothetical protein